MAIINKCTQGTSFVDPTYAERQTAAKAAGLAVKINTVVMDGKNTEDIIPLAQLTKENDITVRFIEEMPFNGEGKAGGYLVWSHRRIYDHLREAFPAIHKVSDPENSTAFHYKIPGYRGAIGIIAAYSRTFCGT